MDYNVTNNWTSWNYTNGTTMPHFEYPTYFTKEELMELIPTSIVYILIFFIGLIGNTLIIFVISRYRRMRTISNIFLASLSAADLLLILVCIPVKLARIYSFTWTLGEFNCKFVYYLQNLSAICSVLTLTAISIERFYAIVYPIKAKIVCTTRNTRNIIITIWMLSLLMAVPVVHIKIHLPIGMENSSYYWCVIDWDNKPFWQAYELYMFLSVLILPGIVMSVSYGIVIYRVWKVMLQRAGISGNNKSLLKPVPANTENFMLNPVGNNHESLSNKSSGNFDQNCLGRRNRSAGEANTLKQIIKMLVAVVVLFLVCWTPILMTNVLTAYNYLPELNKGFTKPMRIVFHLMSYFNSCVNPIVYGFMSKNFRSSFKNAFNAILRKDRRHRRASSSFNNGTNQTTVVSTGKSMVANTSVVS